MSTNAMWILVAAGVLLGSVADKGYARGYRGLRIAKSGRRFWIEE